MNIGAFLLVLAVLIVVGVYLYLPFLGRGGRRQLEEEAEVSVLLAERDRVISALQELDFDFGLGKVPTDDYPGQRSALVQKGADILRRLDEIAPQRSARRGDAASRVEASAASRDDTPGQNTLISEDDMEALIAARHRSRKEKSAGFCPRCGRPVLVSDRFCPACGKALAA